MIRKLIAAVFVVLAAAFPAVARSAEPEGRGPEGREIEVAFDDFDWKQYLDTDEWYGLYNNKKKIGYMSTRITREKGEGGKGIVRISTRAHMTIKAMGQVVETGMFDVRDYSAADGKLKSITVNVDTAGFSIAVKARAEGEELVCETTVAGKASEARLPLPNESLVSALALQALVAREDVAVGDRLAGAEVFDPTFKTSYLAKTSIKKKSTLSFRGVPVEVFEVEVQRFTLPGPGQPLAEGATPAALEFIKIDASGRPIEGSMMGTFTFRLESEEDARKMDKVSDIMLTSSVPVGIVAGAHKSKKAVLEVEGMPATSMMESARQKFEKQEGETYQLTLTVDPPAGKAVPLTADEKEKLAEYLKPTDFLQSDDPEVIKVAVRVVGEETDPHKAAGKLSDWVYGSIAKVFTPAVSNASDTLKSLEGDCGEHAALFTALCRASGIPAREVAGLAYTDSGGGILGGHAWTEIYAGGRWWTMDPTFGQKNADALHIKVAEGGMSGMDSMMRLADLLGKLKVKVVSVE